MTAAIAAPRVPGKFTIIDALEDPHLLGGLAPFHDLSTWSKWIVFLKASYGLPLDDDELPIFRHHTGRSVYDPPPGGYPENVCVVGRQSGKSRVAAAVAAFEALRTPSEKDGTAVYAILVAQDSRSAINALFSYAWAPFDQVPILQASVSEKRATDFSLKSGVVVAAYPCRPGAVRGIRIRSAVVDELGFFISTSNRPTDEQMLVAIRPALSMTGGKLFMISSPAGKTGALYRIFQKNFGRDDSTTLVWKGTAAEMNPRHSAADLARMKRDDPVGFRTEMEAEFKAGTSNFLDSDALGACVVSGRTEMRPIKGVHYSAFVDPSGGSKDAFSLAIGHEEKGRVIIDLVRGWEAPFKPTGVVAEIKDVVKSYGIHTVTGDRYAGEWPREQFRAHGIEYKVSALDRSKLYLEMLPLVNSGAMELPDNPTLIAELERLERRSAAAGRDRVDHPPGEHDDLANSAAGVAWLLAPGTDDPLRHIF